MELETWHFCQKESEDEPCMGESFKKKKKKLIDRFFSALQAV